MLSLLVSSANADTDVSSKFYSYASGLCNGGVHNADIGNGNLVNGFAKLGVQELDQEAYALGKKHSAMSKEEIMDTLGHQPGADTPPSAANAVLGCDEQWGDTCQNSGGLYHWCNYSQYKCMSKYSGQRGAVEYYNMNKSPAVPETYEIFIDNASDEDTEGTISKEVSTSSTQQISTTVSFEMGMSLEISAGIPEIMDVKESFEWKFDMSTTRMDSKTTSDKFSYSQPIPEKAQSTTMVQFTVTKEKYSGAWRAEIDLPYYAKIWCGDRTNGHYEWFIPAGAFLGAGPYQGQGVFTGGAGTSMHTGVRTCPLFAQTVDECPKSTEELFAPAHVE